MAIARWTRYGLAAAVLAAASVAHAADRNGNFAVKGVGLERCETYLGARAQNAPLAVLAGSWLNGYLSAHNQLTPGTYDIAGQAGLNGLLVWLDGYCDKNRSQPLVVAATALITVLEPNRTVQRPQSGPARLSEADREMLRGVQAALKAQGFYKGAIDGLYGPGTRAALEAFQRKEGLTVTGQPDAATLVRLRR